MASNQRENQTLKDILFIAPVGMGNVILLIPTLKACKQALPRCRLTVVVTNRPSQEILLTCSYVDEVILFGVPSLRKPRASLRQLKRVHQLRQRRFDVTITGFPCNHAFYNLLAFAVGAPVRIAHHYSIQQGRSLSFLQNVQVPMQRVHDVEQNLELLTPMIAVNGCMTSPPQLWIPDDIRSQAQVFLNSCRQGLCEIFMGFHAGSSVAHQMHRKRWPVEKFIQLAQELLHEHCGKDETSPSELRIILFGGREETELNHLIAKQVHPSPIVFFSPSMLQTAALIQQLSVFVSNDSGLMHVAAAVGVPTVGIFGPTDPLRTAPYGNRHTVVQTNLECRPCWPLEEVGRRKRCGHTTRRCLTELPVSSVTAAIHAILEKPE